MNEKLIKYMYFSKIYKSNHKSKMLRDFNSKLHLFRCNVQFLECVILLLKKNLLTKKMLDSD